MPLLSSFWGSGQELVSLSAFWGSWLFHLMVAGSWESKWSGPIVAAHVSSWQNWRSVMQNWQESGICRVRGSLGGSSRQSPSGFHEENATMAITTYDTKELRMLLRRKVILSSEKLFFAPPPRWVRVLLNLHFNTMRAYSMQNLRYLFEKSTVTSR